MFALTSEPPKASGSGASVAIVTIDGPLEQRATEHLCGYADGYDAIAARVTKALNDPSVGALVLRIDSPGGDLAGLEESVKRMQAARDASGKAVFAYVDEQAASAAYWIAAGVASGGVFVPESGEVGSIGVIAAVVDQSKALEAEGLGVTLVRDPPGKAASNPMGPVTELAMERVTALVQEASGRFAKAMADVRGISISSIRDLNGATARGSSAVRLGLADGVKSFEDVMALAADAAQEKRMSDEKAAEIQAQARYGVALMAAIGVSDQDEAVGLVDAWKKSHALALAERAENARKAKMAEDAERVDTIVKLVVAGWETPATAWADPTSKEKVPSEVFASMSIGALRARATTLLAQPRSAGTGGPESKSAGHGLSEQQLAICKETGCDPQEFARLLNARTSEK